MSWTKGTARLLLAVILCVGLATAGWATSQAEQATAKSKAAPGPFGKYEPPISISTVRSQLAGLPNIKYAEGEDMTKNVWTKAYHDELGIDLTFKWIVDQSQYEQKTNLMIASGDLPDFFEATKIQFQQLLDAGLVQDLTAAYKNNVADYTDMVIHEGGDIPLQSATVGGKLMAVPFTDLTRESVHIIFVRTDWRKKLGLPEPRTMQDYLAIVKAFTHNDPDGNGKDDTYGMPLDKDLWGYAMGFFNGYHAYPNTWIKDATGKKLTYGSIQPEVKTALAKLAEMYADGQIDKDFAVKDSAKADEGIAAGRTGTRFGYFYTPLGLQASHTNDKNAQWDSYPIVSADAQPARPRADVGVRSYWVVKKGYTYPEAIVKMLNLYEKYFYQNTDDKILQTYVNTPDGNAVWNNSTPQAYRQFKNVNANVNVAAVLKGDKAASALTPEERGYLDYIHKYQAGDDTMWAWERIFGVQGACLPIKVYKDNKLYVDEQFYGPPTPTMTDRLASLKSRQAEVFTKIIMGLSPVSAFDDWVKEWKQQGGDAITAEVNAWFAKR